MESIKSCACKTSEVIVRDDDDVRCAVCGARYLLRNKPYSLKLPIRHKIDGRRYSEIVEK